MKAVSKSRLADYIEPRLSDARIERMWASIEADRPPSSQAPRWWLAAGAAALVAIAAMLLIRPWSGPSTAPAARAEPPSSRADSWLATGTQERVHRLADGTEIELAAATQVRIEHADPATTRLHLERGQIDVRIPAGANRRLTVAAGPAEIGADRGRFQVELEMRPDGGPVLRVSAEDGRVEVLNEIDGARLATLETGQTWTNAKLSDDAPRRKTVTPTARPPTPTGQPTTTRIPTPAPGAPTAAELLAVAQRHRRAGDPRAAAAAYEQLRHKHPGDARAGLAAFELARIRLDHLGNARGALQAFDAALSSGKGGFFVEDAAAGRVRALSRLGDAKRCARARAAFLKTHPNSPHAPAIRALCKAR